MVVVAAVVGVVGGSVDVGTVDGVVGTAVVRGTVVLGLRAVVVVTGRFAVVTVERGMEVCGMVEERGTVTVGRTELVGAEVGAADEVGDTEVVTCSGVVCPQASDQGRAASDSSGTRTRSRRMRE